MITTKEITSADEKMTEEQEKQIKRFIEDGILSLRLTKTEAQEIIKNGGKMQKGVNSVLKGLSIADKRFGPAIMTFELTVPENYSHDTQLKTFEKENRKKFYYFNDAATDKNFKKATTQLKPGQKFEVTIFSVNETVASEDCMEFLKSQNAVLVGAQGLSLVWPVIKEKFPTSKAAISFDQKDALWEDSDGSHRVPNLGRRSDGDWLFALGYFERPWDSDRTLVCFRDISA